MLSYFLTLFYFKFEGIFQTFEILRLFFSTNFRGVLYNLEKKKKPESRASLVPLKNPDLFHMDEC